MEIGVNEDQQHVVGVQQLLYTSFKSPHTSSLALFRRRSWNSGTRVPFFSFLCCFLSFPAYNLVFSRYHVGSHQSTELPYRRPCFFFFYPVVQADARVIWDYMAEDGKGGAIDEGTGKLKERFTNPEEEEALAMETLGTAGVTGMGTQVGPVVMGRWRVWVGFGWKLAVLPFSWVGVRFVANRSDWVVVASLGLGAYRSRMSRVKGIHTVSASPHVCRLPWTSEVGVLHVQRNNRRPIRSLGDVTNPLPMKNGGQRISGPKHLCGR